MDYAKTIKIFSIILIVFAVLGFILAVLMFVGGGYTTSQMNNPEVASSIGQENLDKLNDLTNQNMDASTAVGALGVATIFLGVVLLINSVFQLLSGIFGLNAAKGKSANPAFIMGVISLVFGAIGLISMLTQGRFNIGNLGGFIFTCIYVYCAYNLKKIQG